MHGRCEKREETWQNIEDRTSVGIGRGAPSQDCALGQLSELAAAQVVTGWIEVIDVADASAPQMDLVPIPMAVESAQSILTARYVRQNAGVHRPPPASAKCSGVPG